MSISTRSRGSTIRMLVIILVLGGAVAAFFVYQRNSTLQGGVDRMKLYDDALQWRLTFKQLLPKGPPDSFKRLQISVKRDDSDAGDHAIEIGGAVEDQAALDTLNTLLLSNKPPARHTMNVLVQPTPPLSAEDQALLKKELEEAGANRPVPPETAPPK